MRRGGASDKLENGATYSLDLTISRWKIVSVSFSNAYRLKYHKIRNKTGRDTGRNGAPTGTVYS